MKVLVLDMPPSKIHFVNIDWVIYFSVPGNEGRPYAWYDVSCRDGKKGLFPRGRRMNLGDLMALPKIRENYPHTVGYFTNSSGKGDGWTPKYLETREVRSKEEFYAFLRELGI
jgi:hypothetical protein